MFPTKPILYTLVLILLLLAEAIQAQRSISFLHDNLDAALQIAEREGKEVFVDTYAPWCIPCKKMDVVFRDPKLGAFFNDHFVSVRINMDNPIGQHIRDKYGVVFLPTLMFLDRDGIPKYKVDRALEVDELLEIANLVVDTDGYFEPETTRVVQSPITSRPSDNPSMSNEASKRLEPGSDGTKILYVLDGDQQKSSSEMLYKEAYFRVQLMDGSHYEKVDLYLDTQADWTTEKNIRFIFDFLDSSESRLWDFFIEHNSKFAAVIGETQVEQTMKYLLGKSK